MMGDLNKRKGEDIIALQTWQPRIADIKELRRAARVMDFTAALLRAYLISRDGLRRYVHDMLGGRVAHIPASECVLLWPGRREKVTDALDGETIADYLVRRFAGSPYGLPTGIAVDGKEYVL